MHNRLCRVERWDSLHGSVEAGRQSSEETRGLHESTRLHRHILSAPGVVLQKKEQ